MRARGGSWVMLALCSVWAFAFAGWLASEKTHAWTPDLGLALFLAVGPRFARSELFAAALVLALARSAVSIDPPAAIFAGYLAVAGLYGALRSTLDLEGLARRAVLAAVGAAGVGLWLQAVHLTRLGARGLAGPELLSAWRVGLPTAVALLFLTPLVRYVPGLWRQRGPF